MSQKSDVVTCLAKCFQCTRVCYQQVRKPYLIYSVRGPITVWKVLLTIGKESTTCLCLQVLADMIISNESRINRSGVVSNFKKPRQYVASIAIRHKDMLLVDPITAAMKSYLDNSKDIDHGLPYFVGLSGLDNHSCNLGILVRPPALWNRSHGLDILWHPT